MPAGTVSASKRGGAERGPACAARVRIAASAGSRELPARPCAGRDRRGCEQPLRLTPGKMADGIGRARTAHGGRLCSSTCRATAAQARTVAELQAGEQATVAVEVRAISARAVRRRGMRPLVEARVFDASGSMRATFFNQPWLVDRYPPGHAPAAARQGRRTRRLSRRPPRAGEPGGRRSADATSGPPSAPGRRRTRRATSPTTPPARASARRRS